ncbi:hypothetical protein ElyMa_005625300 [Elysia marginata]|uniref:Uncharacterized protein n=1 Tax=Elysia marginata TaxID=1093978 RepID=A0AAV4F893_9GAST|nr:hypothetical protein ElyMa_005625300 [Elysia marginata]
MDSLFNMIPENAAQGANRSAADPRSQLSISAQKVNEQISSWNPQVGHTALGEAVEGVVVVVAVVAIVVVVVVVVVAVVVVVGVVVVVVVVVGGSSLRRELADPLAMRAADKMVALGLGVVQRRTSPAGIEEDV